MSKYFFYTHISDTLRRLITTAPRVHTRVYVSSESFARASRKDISRKREIRTSWNRQRHQLLSSNIVIQICRRHLPSAFPVRPIANLFNPFWTRIVLLPPPPPSHLCPPFASHSFTTGSGPLLARIISAARETLYLEAQRLKWMATRAIRLIARYFELPWKVRTRSAESPPPLSLRHVLVFPSDRGTTNPLHRRSALPRRTGFMRFGSWRNKKSGSPIERR